MATATVERTGTSRDEAAEMLLDVLTEKPQAEAALRRQLFGGDGRQRGAEDVVRNGLRVLEARHQAKRVERGWVLYSSKLRAIVAVPEEIEFPYDFKIVHFSDMFVDPDYQRPLTSFADRIERNFKPWLFQTLTLSDRTSKHKPRRYALIDGQTRWHAAGRRGIQQGPCIVFVGLSPEDEAAIFWQLQKERRGVISWHRFRAQLRSGDELAVAVNKLAESVGFKLGDGQGAMKAVAALEACYKIDAFALERALSDLREAWPTDIPEGRYIRGLHFFLRHFPVDQPKEFKEVNDERLITRLKAAGSDGLYERMLAARKLHRGSPEKLMALAIQSAYLGAKAS